MTPRQWRWFVMALLLGLGGSAACWVWLLDAAQPPHQPPKVLAAPRSPASQAVAVVPRAASVAAAPVVALAPASKSSAVEIRIGSEGYGVHIERALESGDPARAWQAVGWIRKCAGVFLHRDLLARGPGIGSLQVRGRWEAEVRQFEAPCQTVTAQQQNLVRHLALVAAKGQVPGAAALAGSPERLQQLDRATQDQLVSLIQRDLREGDSYTAAVALSYGKAWNLNGEGWMVAALSIFPVDDDDVQGFVRKVSGDEKLVLPEQGSPAWLAAKDAAARIRQYREREQSRELN